MASPYPDYSFGPDYSKGPFPAIPRRAGVAKVTVSTEPAAPSAFPTTAQLVSKEALAAAFPGLEGSDAATDGSAARYEGERRVLFHSFGPAAKADLAAVKRAAVAAVSRARALKVAGGLELVAPAVAGVPAAKVAEGVAQAAALANYAFDRYITAADKLPALLPALHVRLPAGGPDAAAAVAAGELAAALAEATVFARDLSNERADEMNPARLEAEARAVAAEIGASVTVVTGAELLEKGLHLMAAVGQAARHAPRYVELAIAGDPAHPDDVILLVGKGITYDTGGLNIKGTGFMEDMHMDMSGAAAVLGATLALGRARVKRNVVAVLAVAENAIDGAAYKPHAILRSHKGLTVQVGNTDAEGRLVLADALSFGQARHKPHTVIDAATLTGACIVGLGEYAAGLFSNNAALSAGVRAAGAAKGERLWPMPIFAEHREELKSGAAQADVMSTGAGRYGGACTAAAFLELFVGHEPAKNARDAPAGGAADAPAPPAPVAWCHIDLAGPAMYTKARGYMNAGGTGFGVHTIANYVLTAPPGKPEADKVELS